MKKNEKNDSEVILQSCNCDLNEKKNCEDHDEILKKYGFNPISREKIDDILDYIYFCEM